MDIQGKQEDKDKKHARIPIRKSQMKKWAY